MAEELRSWPALACHATFLASPFLRDNEEAVVGAGSQHGSDLTCGIPCLQLGQCLRYCEHSTAPKDLH